MVFGALVEDLIKVVEARGEYLARVWRWKSKEVAFELNKGLTVNSVCVSPNGKYVVTGSSDVDGFARVWRLDDGKFIIRLDTDSFVVHSVCVTPDSAHVVTGSQNCVIVWRLSDFAKVSTLWGHYIRKLSKDAHSKSFRSNQVRAGPHDAVV